MSLWRKRVKDKTTVREDSSNGRSAVRLQSEPGGVRLLSVEQLRPGRDGAGGLRQELRLRGQDLQESDPTEAEPG